MSNFAKRKHGSTYFLGNTIDYFDDIKEYKNDNQERNSLNSIFLNHK